VIYKIATIENFRKEAKRLIRKYPSLLNEINELGVQLSEDPKLGTSLGNSCYKIRLKIASKGRGKSGGARVITCVFVAETTVFLISIYDKAEKSDIFDDELNNLLKFIR
jgi:hypothetical protein